MLQEEYDDLLKRISDTERRLEQIEDVLYATSELMQKMTQQLTDITEKVALHHKMLI